MKITMPEEFPLDDSDDYGPSANANLPEAPSLEGSMANRIRTERAKSIMKSMISLDLPLLQMDDNMFNTWSANGSRTYLDLESVIETASPECRIGSLDILVYEKASERILNLAVKKLIDSGVYKEVCLYKNNTGPLGDKGTIFPEITYGHHQNYMFTTDRVAEISKMLKTFIPISLILSGSGHVHCDEKSNWRYLISPRATHIESEEDPRTVNNRPLINSREQPRRFHLISRDATRCEFQTWLVDMTTHLVMRLAEEGWEMPKGFPLQNPLFSLGCSNKSFEDYLGGPKGRWMTQGSVDILVYNRIFLEAARQLSPLSEAEKDALDEWERVIDLLKHKAIDKLVGELDWATKWFLLSNQMKKDGYGLNDLRAWKNDMAYHDISDDPNQSWFARLDNLGYIRHLIDEEDILHGMKNPPDDTRAFSRGRFVRLALQHDKLREEIRSIDWSEVHIYPRHSVAGGIYCFGKRDDPFATVSSELEELYVKKFGIFPE